MSEIKAMNIEKMARRYNVSRVTFKKWLKNFCPEIQPAPNCKTYTPDQVRRIIEACGEFPD